MSDHLKKNLTTQLELLDESSFHLQSNISDYVQQVKTKALEYIDNFTDNNMTVKDALFMIATAQSVIFEHVNMMNETTKLYPPAVMTGDQTTTESKSFIPEDAQHIPTVPMSGDLETKQRLDVIEKALSSLQDTKHKTEDDISEINQCKDKFIAKQSYIEIKVEKLSKKQKQNVKNIQKQINEQKNEIDNLNKEIKDLKEKETKTDKALENLSLDLTEYKNNLLNTNTKIQAQAEMVENLTQEVKRLSNRVSSIDEEGKKNHVVICKLLQQRLIPIDKIIKTYNQNSENMGGKLKKIESLEKDVLRLSKDFQNIANQQVKHPTLGFVASQGRWDGLIRKQYPVIIFSAVKRNVGNHFDPKTGEFTAPVNGLYMASITIKQRTDRVVGAVICHKSGDVTSRLGGDETKDKSGEASRTVVVWMKTKDVIFLSTGYNDCEFKLFSCSLLDV